MKQELDTTVLVWVPGHWDRIDRCSSCASGRQARKVVLGIFMLFKRFVCKDAGRPL